MLDAPRHPRLYDTREYQPPVLNCFSATPWGDPDLKSMRPFYPAYAVPDNPQTMDQLSHLPSPQSLIDGFGEHEELSEKASIASKLHRVVDPPLFDQVAKANCGPPYAPLFSGSGLNGSHPRTPPSSPPLAKRQRLSIDRSSSQTRTTSSPRPEESRSGLNLGVLASQYPTLEEQDIMIKFVSKAWALNPAPRWALEHKLRRRLEQQNGVLYHRSPREAQRSSLIREATDSVASVPLGKSKSRAPPVPRPQPLRVIEHHAGVMPSRDALEVPRSSPAPTTVSQQRQHDTDWEQVPDYTPPFINLSEDTRNGLKIQARTNTTLDISEMENVELLHPSEVMAASTLRLTPDQYLTVKRRIFQARFESLLYGKSWNKTAAQMRCKIDVNKTSSLWAAYERLGWFDPSLMADHIRAARKSTMHGKQLDD